MQCVRTDGGANSVTMHAAVTVCLVIAPMEGCAGTVLVLRDECVRQGGPSIT